jgi:tRNA nucleotidyltransferase (CCA-adding enzyme)
VRIYRVGGSVRDELLGRAGADRDFVVVGATPETMLASGFRAVGRDFPVFLHPETQDEYALARTERKHGRGYRGFEFFASPDVTLEQDLERRDLTINAMARGDDGVLIDPHGGRADLAAGVLRHVSPAFAEDPLRVLRVARFAARYDFTVAPETEALMREIVASGELATLAPERVWQEWAKGLMEAHPARMLAVLRGCGALRALLPEVDLLFGIARPRGDFPEVDAGVHVALALDWAARHDANLAARFAVLAHDLDTAVPPQSAGTTAARRRRNVEAARRLADRLRVPVECRDAAVLTARWRDRIDRATTMPPAELLDVLAAVDALRRPDRLDAVLEACTADACARPGAPQAFPAAAWLSGARAAARAVDAGAQARRVAARGPDDRRDEAIAHAVRSARLRALGDWKRARRADQTR